MRVAIIGSRGYPYVYSGYETLVKELSERLVDRGIEVTVYCHKNLFKDKPKRLKGIDLVYLPSLETKVLSQLTHSFLSVVHACFSNVDVIFVVNSANGPFGLLTRLFQKKTVINVDGLEWLRPKWKGLGARYFYFASWLSTKLYDQLVNDSDEMRRVYLNLFKRESVVIAYGANVRESIDPSKISKWGLTKGEYFLIVGRLIPDNNADLLVEGFLRSNSERKLVIVGDVPYKDNYAKNIKSMAESDDRLLFTGYVTDPEELAELYHNAFVYLHGHEFGGTNPTLLKAMAYGCCILALNTPFSREVLGVDKYGLFFEKNADSVVEKIEVLDIDETLANEFRVVVRQGLTAKYNWDNVSNQYIETFNKVAKKLRN
ncbi:MAG: glycosyltransferase [Imperialibacter sp.]